MSQTKAIRGTIATAGVVFVLCVAALLQPKPTAQRNPPPAAPASITPSKPARQLTMAKYNQITVGMTQPEVESLLGFKGKQKYDARDSTSSSSIYSWEEGEPAERGTIQITFINGKVHDKFQYNLDR
jgi:hypothetical protein